jgi:hypothetical protein
MCPSLHSTAIPQLPGHNGSLSESFYRPPRGQARGGAPHRAGAPGGEGLRPERQGGNPNDTGTSTGHETGRGGAGNGPRCSDRYSATPQTPPIGPPTQAKMASVAAGASVLALAVPQAAQAAQEAFMVAEASSSSYWRAWAPGTLCSPLLPALRGC